MVSVVVAAFNASEHIDEALESVLAQDCSFHFECIVVDDASTDDTFAVASRWQARFDESRRRKLIVLQHSRNVGAGGARNSAIAAASSDWICVLDADDVCSPRRLRLMLEAAEGRQEEAESTLFGSRFERIPENATLRYTEWANSLTMSRMYLEKFREVTLLQPTWFFHRSVWERAGRYDEDGLCDDLRFFHRHLQRGGSLVRVDENLVKYRHSTGLSRRTSRRELVRWKARAFKEAVLSRWNTFSVWGAGRDAKDFVNALCSDDPEVASRIVALHDVDENKLAAGKYINKQLNFSLEIKRVSSITKPFVVCVALGRGCGEFESAVRAVVERMKLEEGVDYWHFN